MEQDIRFCTTSDGVRIAYATVGQGPPLVRVLGWFTHLEFEWEYPLWRRFIDPVSSRFLLIRYDGRGMGLSDRGVKDLSLDAHVRDLEAVVDATGVDKVALLGLSQGGPVAVAYAVRRPDRVSHLIVYGSFARDRRLDTEEGRQQAMAMAILIRDGWGVDSPALRQFWTGVMMPDADGDAIGAFNELQRVSAHPDDVLALRTANAGLDVRALLPQVTRPTLVIHRRGDTGMPFELGRELAAGIPGARFLPLDGRNHCWFGPNDPARDIIVNAIEEFVGGGRQTEAVAAPSGLLTILFTDMESSTALTQRLGDAKAQELLRKHNDIVRDALESRGGSEIKHTGDGIMASFPSASGALECAVAIQQAVASHVEQQPGTPLGVRIGLNAGEPVAEEEDLFGTAVQLARRICDRAEAGEILASDVVRQLAAGKGFLFSDRGDTALRGFEDPVRLYEVRWEG